MSTPAKKHRRHFGKVSPLDRLPESVQAEMRRRCQGDEAFREIRAWLFTKHHRRTSIESLSQWWRRQQMNGWGVTAQTVTHSAFEIVVTAPGASEVRVQVRALPAPTAPISAP